mmetsp:Transcript_6340/g.13896  ORF Transcript_6340/g.13896 Transcript_6340/m.13896 type:complete len:208 (+) Transcript_6340:277-900(+)
MCPRKAPNPKPSSPRFRKILKIPSILTAMTSKCKWLRGNGPNVSMPFGFLSRLTFWPATSSSSTRGLASPCVPWSGTSRASMSDTTTTGTGVTTSGTRRRRSVISHTRRATTSCSSVTCRAWGTFGQILRSTPSKVGDSAKGTSRCRDSHASSLLIRVTPSAVSSSCPWLEVPSDPSRRLWGLLRRNGFSRVWRTKPTPRPFLRTRK